MNSQPLTDAEFEQLSEILGRLGNKRAMNLEQLDGFLSASICGPELVPPSKYLPMIWGNGATVAWPFAARAATSDSDDRIRS